MGNYNYNKQSRTLVLLILPWMIITMVFYFGNYVLQMNAYDYISFFSFGAIVASIMVLVCISWLCYRRSRKLVLLFLPWVIIIVFFCFGTYVLQMDIYDYMLHFSFLGGMVLMIFTYHSWFWLFLSIVALVSAHKAKKAGCEKIAWVYRLAITETILFSAVSFHLASEFFTRNL